MALFSEQTASNHILVIVDPEEVSPQEPGASGLLARAVEVARAAGCRLELFQACHDPSLELQLFAANEQIVGERKRRANTAAVRMAKLAHSLKSSGVEISHEVRWDDPYPEAILRKIADANPALVMKESQGPNFIIGLTDQTDWELIRNSRAHLWFVKDGRTPIDTVLTAVGGCDAEAIIAPQDYEVFDIAATLASSLGAQNLPVHTYQVPRLQAFATYAPALGTEGTKPEPVTDWENIAQQHAEAIFEFARHFDVDPRKIQLSRGHPAEVLPKLGESLEAGLIVMGARNLGRWERLFTSVSAEPVLSEAPCDVLFVKEISQIRASIEQCRERLG